MRRVSRRAFLAGAGSLLLGACRRGTPATRTASPVAPATIPRSPATGTPTTRPLPQQRASPQPTPAASPTPRQEQVLYRGDFLADPASHDFNANLACGGDPSLWAGLLAVDASYNVVPDWAFSWTPNEDASRWTFRLRANTGWSNGEPVTAQDFVWSWQRMLDPATGADHAWILFDVVNAAAINRGELPPDQLGVRALDQSTLEVSLVGPRVYFPAIAASLATVPANRTAVEAFGDAWTEAANIVSNGPFSLSAWEHGQRLATTRSAHYWNAADVALSRTVAPILAPQQHTQPYVSRLVDYLQAQPGDLQDVRGNPALAPDLHPAVVPAIWVLIPSSASPFDSLPVRQALGHVIDRKRLVQITGGTLTEATAVLPPGFPGRPDEQQVAALQRFDVDAALSALSGTPYAGGQNWPTITLVAPNDPEAHALAQDLVAQLAENLGINTRLVDAAADVSQPSDARAELRLLRWEYLYPDPNNAYGDLFFPPGTDQPRLSIIPAGLRELVESARSEMDPAKRLPLYTDCERLLLSQVAYMPLAHPVSYYLVHRWVRHFPSQDNTLVPPSRLFTRLASLLDIQGRPVQ